MSRTFVSSEPNSDRYPYEVGAFEQKQGLSRRAAEVILHSNGPSRHQCDAAARAYVDYMALRQAKQASPPAAVKPAHQAKRLS
ncbi:hypothetical protein AB6802_09280 [Mesorhizobium sp. RCC_202]|jgi:hypothetical protein|uniref:hypothetical protein n=1 Tax=Mesorhizobium sp. RCC_202 TaxID=3239222 RepID=UPI001D9A3E2D|nr:hypothetical protein [Mesorhizobium sp.]